MRIILCRRRRGGVVPYGGMRERAGRVARGRQEPLELDAGNNARADGPRPPGHRVHRAPGRRPGKLHGDQLVRENRASPADGHGLRGQGADRPRRHDPLRAPFDAWCLQDGLRARRLRGDDGRQPPHELRRRLHRDNGLRVRLVRVRPAEERAAGVREPAAADFLPGTRRPRALPEPGRRVEHVGRPQRAQNVLGPVHQHVSAPLHVVADPVQGPVPVRQGPATFRPGGTRQAFDSVQ